jgi:hypothetical protein
MDLESYVIQVLQEHLLTPDYSQLSQTEMKHRMSNLRSTLQSIITINQDKLNKAEITYFQRSMKTHFRLPIFYGLPKVHKTPMSLHPVISCSNSLLSVFSIWLDHKAKELLPLIQSYLKNSTALIQSLKNIHIPDNALLFTADAKSMYTNIDITTGLTSISNFFHTNERNLPTNFPSALFQQILEIVMKNNIFSFADSYWLQLCGTATGTPVACAYATLTFGHHKNTVLLPTFSNNLLFYRRYIDDVFGIWLPTPGDSLTWENFKKTLNNWCKLEWTVKTPSKKTHFLDLNITIEKSSIVFSTYQKPLNLYLYIPPSSAHPTSCLKGLIKGELQRYWLQNQRQNFEDLVTKFIERLHARGHSLESLSQIFLQTAESLDITQRAIRTNTQNTNNDNTLYIHWTYHPKDLQCRDIPL